MQTSIVEADHETTLERVRLALERDPRVEARAHPLTLALSDGTLVIDGEVADVPAKTRAVEVAQVIPEVHRVVDRLVVIPPVKMEDGELRALYTSALLGENAFDECRIEIRQGVIREPVRDPERPRGTVIVSIASGIVTLEGAVPSLSHARLAGVLAWWIPGTRAVRNELHAEPPEEDTDDELTDAVEIALEKEPLVDADQVGIRTAGGRVTLLGTLPSEKQRDIAARDAWYVLGVTDVDNRIEVSPVRGTAAPR